MSEIKGNPNAFKEAVCIEAMRIYDSCSDKDCLEDLEVVFENGSQIMVDNAAFIKSKEVEVTNVYFTIEPVPFNKGFYSIDITFMFRLVVEAYANSTSAPETVSGKAQFCKKVILYGSDGAAKKFHSDDAVTTQVTTFSSENLPRATVQAAEPIVLDCKLVSKCPSPIEPDGEALTHKQVYVTLGMFSIVQLQRPVPILIPCYDYCVPQKECTTTNDSPCELFEKIKFPTDEFFPPSLEDIDNS